MSRLIVLMAAALVLLAAILLSGCPGPAVGKAVPAPVEIDWPDAGVAEDSEPSSVPPPVPNDAAVVP